MKRPTPAQRRAQKALEAVAKHYNVTTEQVLKTLDEAVVAVIRSNHTVH